MRRFTAFAVLVTVAVTFSNCSLKKGPLASDKQSVANLNKPASSTAEIKPPTAQPGELQPGQASGTYTAKGEVVELKYAYAGRAQRFGSQSLVILLTETPIPPEAVAEEIKSTPLLEGEKIRGLEYAIDDNGMWVRYHPSQYQESSNNKLKDYKVENEVVRGFDDNDGSLSNGKYARSVKFVAAIVK